MYVVGIAMQGDTDVWTRTGGHVDKCKYHFIWGFMVLVHFTISLYSKVKNLVLFNYFNYTSQNIPIYHKVVNYLKQTITGRLSLFIIQQVNNRKL